MMMHTANSNVLLLAYGQSIPREIHQAATANGWRLVVAQNVGQVLRAIRICSARAVVIPAAAERIADVGQLLAELHERRHGLPLIVIGIGDADHAIERAARAAGATHVVILGEGTSSDEIQRALAYLQAGPAPPGSTPAALRSGPAPPLRTKPAAGAPY